MPESIKTTSAPNIAREDCAQPYIDVLVALSDIAKRKGKSKLMPDDIHKAVKAAGMSSNVGGGKAASKPLSGSSLESKKTAAIKIVVEAYTDEGGEDAMAETLKEAMTGSILPIANVKVTGPLSATEYLERFKVK